MRNYIVDKVLHYCNIHKDRCSAFSNHKISFYDFTFVLNGSMTYIVDDKICVLKKNDAIFLKPGTTRSRLLGTEPVKYVSFNFTTSKDVVFPFEPHIKNCITSDIRKLVSIFPQSHLSAYYHSEEKIASLLNYILYELLDTVSFKSSNEHVLKILKYIEEHVTEEITLKDISKEVNLSKEYTSYIFKKEIGKTIINYINEKKILFAKDLIVNQKMELADIASYLGFASYNYFSRLFKKYYDISPIALKNRK